jgi:5-methylcytosine-specific restriction endonuclease McrA
MSYAQTLVLNQHYRPHEIVDWKDAVTKMFKGTVTVLAQYDEVLAHIDRQTLRTFPELRRALSQVIGTDAESLVIKVPAVAVLRRKVQAMKSGIKFSKINVFQRDGWRCSYCDKKLPMSELNYDHVVPRSKGGKTEWCNIVTACRACNEKKADLSLEESGMTLLVVPHRPRVLPLHGPRVDIRSAPLEWHPYIEAA